MKATSMSWTALEEERTGVTARVARQLPVVYLGRRLQCHRRVISECRGDYLVRLVSSGSTSTCLYRLRSRAHLSPVLRTRRR